MIDKMQQTVVVDYSSNVDVASMEYEKLEFEQEVFDFIWNNAGALWEI